MHIHGHSRLSTMWYIVHRHKLVAGNYVSRWLSLCLSVCSSVRSLYIRPSVRTSFPFDSLSIYKRISFRFCICICTTFHRYPIFSTRYSVMCKVYTGYCGTSEIEHGLCACTVDNPLAKARGLSLRTGAQPMLYLLLVPTMSR